MSMMSGAFVSRRKVSWLRVALGWQLVAALALALSTGVQAAMLSTTPGPSGPGDPTSGLIGMIVVESLVPSAILASAFTLHLLLLHALRLRGWLAPAAAPLLGYAGVAAWIYGQAGDGFWGAEATGFAAARLEAEAIALLVAGGVCALVAMGLRAVVYAPWRRAAATPDAAVFS